jgi:hypothetical protein
MSFQAQASAYTDLNANRDFPFFHKLAGPKGSGGLPAKKGGGKGAGGKKGGGKKGGGKKGGAKKR